MDRSASDRGRQASIEGFANENIVCGLLMKKYQNVSQVDLPLSPYDLVLARKMSDGSEDIIRIQCKTAPKNVSFTGGSRGGVDRTYKSGVKSYTQSPKYSDCVVGIHFDNGTPHMFFIPTCLIEEWKKKSISLNKITKLKDNFELLENCKNKEFVIAKAKEYGILG